jgi:CRISPR-associated endonuclease/helicase Cas3
MRDGVNFAEQFEVLTGHKPYPWHVRLFESLVAGHVPDLCLPTGSGKTNSIVCWLLAHAQNTSLPCRLAYVVDRRSVVDQSTKVVEEMYAKIQVDEMLAKSLGLVDGLGISTLRGEYADNREWSRLPHRPSVIVGTVDMIGSRLLFSGYGDGAYYRALHAGLLGNDTLVVFDECHLVPAFERLLRNVESAGGKLKPFRVMAMSATGKGHASLELHTDDLVTEPLASRLHAAKKIQLIKHPQVTKKIFSLAKDNPPLRTIVFVQSPSTAVEIASQLTGKVVTLTGTMRGKERDDLVDNPIFQAFTRAEQPTEPHFLVATSAGEVGIDLTCSRLITDATGAPSLIQRFGRCNRFAEVPSAEMHVVTCDKDWAIYGDDLNFITSLNGDGSCMSLWNHREQVSALMHVPELIPTLDASVLDVLSMTSLHNDIPVDEYLRGRQKDSRYVDICFRQEAGLLADMKEPDFVQYLRQFPILSFEKLAEKASRVSDLVGEVLETGQDQQCAVIMPDGENVGTTLSKLPTKLTNCLLILPTTCGLGLQSGMLVKSDGDTLLDISTIEHKHHPARTRLILNASEEFTVNDVDKVVFDCVVDDKRIMIVKAKQAKKSGKKELLADHSAAVRQVAAEFATKAVLSAELIEAFTEAGAFHDTGKANPIWQLAAKGGNIKVPIAKTSYVNASRLEGFRHEFESMDSVSGELEKHTIAVHHAGGRPTWMGTRPLSPVNQDENKVYEQILRFAALQKKYGWWGLAYLEAILKCADASVSEGE